MSFGANYLLETRKANVELEKTHAIETRQSLQTLSNHLVLLDLKLGNLVTTIELVPHYGSNSKLSVFAKKSIGHVAEQMGLIFADVQSPRIRTDVAGHVREILDALGPRLEQAQNDMKNIGGLAELYKTELKERMKKVQGEIDQTIRRTGL